MSTMDPVRTHIKNSHRILKLVVLECDVQYHCRKYKDFLKQKLESLKSKLECLSAMSQTTYTELVADIEETTKHLEYATKKQELISEMVLQTLKMSCGGSFAGSPENASAQIANIIADLQSMHTTARERMNE